MSKKNKIKIKWQADDGYVGGARPQTLHLDPDDFIDCENIEEGMDLVSREVQNDFAQKVSPSYDDEAVRKQIEAMLADRKEEGQ